MDASPSKLSESLYNQLFTTKDLKTVSDLLESLSQNKTFKTHAQNIVVDSNLTDGQKKTQLLYLFQSIDNPVLYDFFSDILEKRHLWLFSSDKIDYFDRFVQEFQNLADNCRILYLITPCNLNSEDIQKVARQFKTGLGFRVLIDAQVNPAILGGVQVKLENYLFDISLRTKLRQFESEWLKTLDQTSSQVGSHDIT
jgi:F0F1-type ATP synthase delta subunit